MRLAIDLGNSTVNFCIIDDNLGTRTHKVCSTKELDYHYLEIMFLNYKFDVVLLSSVVPAKSLVIFDFFKNKSEIFEINPKTIQTNFKNKIDHPDELGADRICTLAALVKKYQKNTLLIDAGTATTFDIIDENGDYIGGIIAPGMHAINASLHNCTALLPQIEVKKHTSLITTNTIDAMQSGVFNGYVAMIDGLITKITVQYDKPLTVVITGGLSSVLLEEIKKIDYKEQDLWIDGILELERTNKVNNDVKF